MTTTTDRPSAEPEGVVCPWWCAQHYGPEDEQPGVWLHHGQDFTMQSSYDGEELVISFAGALQSDGSAPADASFPLAIWPPTISLSDAELTVEDTRRLAMHLLALCDRVAQAPVGGTV